MTKTQAAGAADNDLKVLAPEVVTWQVGDQEFEQSPATLDQLADIMDVIVDEVLASGNNELLDKLMSTATASAGDKDKDKDAEGDDEKDKGIIKSVAADRDLITGLVRIVATLPRSMPKICAAIVVAPGVDIEMESYLRANLRPKEAFGIFRAFIKQNDVGSIIRDFSALFQEFQTEMAPDESSND